MASDSQKIGVSTATITGMNAMIGSGIFTTPATMAANVGPAGILAYIFVVIAVWFMAQSLARVASLFPEEGSFYAYTKQWGGHTLGMIASFSYVIGLLIAMGLLAQAAGETIFVLSKHIAPDITPNILGLVTLGALILLNLFGVHLSELGQQILIVCTLFPLVATTTMCFLNGSFANLTPFAPYGFGNVLKATRVVIFGFFGFEAAASLFTVVKNPEKNVPRALTYAIAIVGSVYTLFISSIIFATPLTYFTNPRLPLTETLKIVFPGNEWILTVILVAILSAILGTLHSMVWSSSALLTSLIKKIGEHRNRPLSLKPEYAVLFVGLCIFLSYVTFKDMNLFFYFTALFIIVAYILSMITLLTIKSEWQSGQNIKTIIGIATASVILYFSIEGIVLAFTKIT